VPTTFTWPFIPASARSRPTILLCSFTSIAATDTGSTHTDFTNTELVLACAPTNKTVHNMATPSPAEPISKRERELYKYFQPTLFQREHVSETPKSPDPTLTAFTQLVTLKLGARRCNINLLDRRDQYNIAEGTKTLHLGSNISDDPKDSLIFGCTPASSTDSICLYTMRATSAPDGRPGFFEVLNLTNDRRFSSSSFVVGPPHVKYYYGAPLKAKNGVAIGALCVLDDRVRKPMSLDQRNCRQ